MSGWRIKECLEGVVEGGLVFFDGEKVVGSVLQNEDASGFVLGVEGIKADHAPVEIELLEESTSDGDFIGLLRGHNRAAQIELGCRGNGSDDRVTASVPRFLAVDVDEFGGIRFAADLVLDLQEDFFEFLGFDSSHQTAKCRLFGRGVFAVAAADAQGPTLAIAQSGRKLFEILLPAGSSTKVGKKDDSQQAPEWVDADAGTVVGHRFEVPDDGTDFCGTLRGALMGFGFHSGQ